MSHNSRLNPYVGPRSFEIDETLYGRDQELRQLSAQLTSERIVLLHSPSGAGKTSLIQAGLIPLMQKEKFHVLPVVRVNLEPDAEVVRTPGFNRYVYSVITSLEEDLSLEQRRPLVSLANLSLDDYLRERPRLEDAPRSDLLIFDQFEEILTTLPTDRADKLEFFSQLGLALRAHHRWALFSMREDYLGALAPYVRPIPNRLEATFRLDLLGYKAAIEAIQKPASGAKVDFTDEAAHKLVDDLRNVQVQRPDGTLENVPGQYIEPVQLQVVCFRLWETLDETANTITLNDVATVGSVDQSLSEYYATSIAKASQETGIDERSIREWIDTKLITKGGVRGHVLMGSDSSDELDNRAIRLLENAHIIRAEQRAGATWFELAHDRLIDPIRKNNRVWFEANLKLFQKQAALWDQQGRGEGLLLRGKALFDAVEESRTIKLTQDEEDFLQSCRELFKRERRDRRRNQIMTVLAIGAFIAMIFAGVSWALAEDAQATAEKEKLKAEEQTNIANARELAASSIANLESDSELSLHLAMQSIDDVYTTQGEDALRRALVSIPVNLTLMGHSGAINSVDYDNTGKRLITASADGTARIWNAVTGKDVIILRGHSGAITKAIFSPDGKIAATVGEDKTVRIWDAQNGQLVRILIRNSQAINSINFSPDGQRLVTASADKTAQVWDVESGEQIFILAHDAEVRDAVFSPKGTYIASGGYDQIIKIWNPATGELIKSLSNSYSVESLAFSPDEQYLLTTQDYNAVRWDIQNEFIIAYYSSQHSWYLASIAFSPDGQQVITASYDHTVCIWDAVSGTAYEILHGHSGAVSAVAFDPSGEQLATASADQTVRIWNIAEWRKQTLIGFPGFVGRVVYSYDGKRIVTSGDDNLIRIWDPQTGRELNAWSFSPLYYGYRVNRIHFGPNDRQLILSGDDGTWRIWDAKNGAELYQSPPNQFIITDARFSNDGTRIVTTSRDGNAIIWDATTVSNPKRLLVLPVKNAIWSGTFSPDGKLVATVGTGSKVQIWDAQTGQSLRILLGHSDLVVNVEFNSTGKYIVTASVDGTARIWDVATGELLHILKGHTREVTDASFSPDGQLVATVSRDHTVILWNAETGSEINQLFGNKKDITSVSFSPDGRSLVTASLDGTVRIYPIHYIDVLALGRSLLSSRELTCVERVKYLHEEIVCPTPTPELTPTP